jgi:hypothetical protein
MRAIIRALMLIRAYAALLGDVEFAGVSWRVTAMIYVLGKDFS